MPNPTLTPAQVAEAHKLLVEIRLKILELAGNDADLVFAYRRKVSKELTYDERSKPGIRKRLKKQLWKAQEGKCKDCGEALPERGAVLDRKVAKNGYKIGNVELICPRCDFKRQAARLYA